MSPAQYFDSTDTLQLMQYLKGLTLDDLANASDFFMSFGAGKAPASTLIQKGVRLLAWTGFRKLSGTTPVHPDKDMLLSGTDRNGDVCYVIVPKPAWEAVDGLANFVCIFACHLPVATAVIVESLRSPTPRLLPALLPAEIHNLTQQIAQAISKFGEVPRDMEDSLNLLLASIKIINPMNPDFFRIPLKRVGSKPEKSELYTRSRISHKRIPIYQTCLDDRQAISYPVLTISQDDNP